VCSGRAFAISSVLVPYCMGAIAGGIASGRVACPGRRPRRSGVGCRRRGECLCRLGCGAVAVSVAWEPHSLAAASPSGTLTAVLAVVALASVILLSGFALLYVLDQNGLLPEDGVNDVGD
jgi:hypothetical protein